MSRWFFVASQLQGESSGLCGVSVLSPGAPELWEQCPLAVNLCFPAGGEDQQHANKPPSLRSEAAGAKTLASLWDSSPHHDGEPSGPSSASQLLPTNLFPERIYLFIKLFRETWPQLEIATYWHTFFFSVVAKPEKKHNLIKCNCNFYRPEPH